MIYYEIIDSMRDEREFSRKDLRKVIRQKNPDFNFNNLSSLLERYLRQNLIKKIDKDQYTVITNKKTYTYQLSQELKEIHDFLEERYPEINFQVWEFSQLNEFLNHLLANKTYVIEVESSFVESFFDILKEKYSKVQLTPTVEEFYRYAEWGTIVVKKLI